MTVKRVYVVTTHGPSEFIPTPQRHPLCPPQNGDWTISKSHFSEEGSVHIWCCDIETALPAKPPSKFHPNAGKAKPAKKAKKKPAKKAVPKPLPAPPKPEPEAKAKKAPKAAKHEPAKAEPAAETAK
jgi:hypothetical protein